jgi:glycosyltransferase involved in cell wall biosynthesis
MPKVTVAIPTFNRFELLMRAISSVLAQTYLDFELLVIDNASTDDTHSLASFVNDRRLRYVRNDTNMGIIGNWNRAIELSSSEYLIIFHDDDVMHPTLLEKSVEALDKFPTVGFCFPFVKRVDRSGRFLNLWCDNYGVSGMMTGIRYLEITLAKERCISMAPSMVFRSSVYNAVGSYKEDYGHNTFDLNLFAKATLHFDVYLIDEVLFDYTIHEQQMSERHWRTPESPSGPIGMLIELVGIVSALLAHDYSNDISKREFLADRLSSINRNLMSHIKTTIPDI